MHMAYRWFCRLDLDDAVPDHSTFSVNCHGRFRDSDLFGGLEDKKKQCTRAPFRKIARDINEKARDHARSFTGTPEFDQSSNQRKKVEMRFAHLKTHHRFERTRLRGLSGARDEFHLAATVQNLKTLANYLWPSPLNAAAACVT